MPSEHLRIAMQKEIPGLRVSTTAADRVSYSRDTWPLFQIRLQQRRAGHLPEVVVWPRDAEETAAVYRFASRRLIPVTPVGAGSGVCGGAIPEENGIVLDLKGMTGPVDMDLEAGVAEAGAGWLGSNLEDELNRAGCSAGHFPSSIMCSTLGGWLAARGAGQLSTRYGKFEDRVRAVEWVFPDGTVEWISADTPWGEGALELLMGSEGTMGVATRVRFRVDPLPEVRLFRSYSFSSVADGLDGIRRVLQEGIRPAAVRLYDPLDTLLAKSLKTDSPDEAQATEERPAGGFGSWRKLLMQQAERVALMKPAIVQRFGERLARDSIMILMFEGPKEAAAWQARRSDEILSGIGRSEGEAPARAWLAHRYDVSFKQSAVYSGGGFADTMEVAFPWSRLLDGYDAVRHALAGELLVLAHFSHVYEQGGSIYFTFSANARSPQRNERLYREAWRQGLDAVVRAGGTITHHHGVGILKAQWMQDELQAGHAWLRGVKSALDPDRIANPGKLGL